MPLFICSECECVDNTALGNFWSRQINKQPPLCAECDPGIGKWHDAFDKVKATDEERAQVDSQGLFRNRVPPPPTKGGD